MSFPSSVPEACKVLPGFPGEKKNGYSHQRNISPCRLRTATTSLLFYLSPGFSAFLTLTGTIYSTCTLRCVPIWAELGERGVNQRESVSVTEKGPGQLKLKFGFFKVSWKLRLSPSLQKNKTPSQSYDSVRSQSFGLTWFMTSFEDIIDSGCVQKSSEITLKRHYLYLWILPDNHHVLMFLVSNYSSKSCLLIE